MTSTIEWRSIITAAVAIAGLPTLWNIIARHEYRHHTLERFTGSKKRGAYLLAAWIFLGSLLRDAAFMRAIAANPSSRIVPLLSIVNNNNNNSSNKLAKSAALLLKLTSTVLVTCGSTLVMTAFLRLGVLGTYLGDYFGIRMRERVESFPFNYFRSPMYLGATLNFLGAALANNSSVGVMLTAWVAIVYHVATTYFEDPFTNMMYGNNDDKDDDKAH